MLLKNQTQILKKGPFYPQIQHILMDQQKKNSQAQKIKLIYLQILLKKDFSRKLLSLQSRKTHLYIRTIIFIVKMVLPQINIVKKDVETIF